MIIVRQLNAKHNFEQRYWDKPTISQKSMKIFWKILRALIYFAKYNFEQRQANNISKIHEKYFKKFLECWFIFQIPWLIFKSQISINLPLNNFPNLPFQQISLSLFFNPKSVSSKKLCLWLSVITHDEDMSWWQNWPKLRTIRREWVCLDVEDEGKIVQKKSVGNE